MTHEAPTPTPSTARFVAPLPVATSRRLGVARAQRVLLPLLALGGVLAAASIGGGCVNSVVAGASDVGGSGGQGTAHASVTAASVTGSGSGGSGATALALLPEELPADAMPCGLNQCDVPAGMLFIEIASIGNTCQAPHGDVDAPSNHWQAQIGLPVQYQSAGTYSLGDPLIYVEGTERLTQPSGTASASGSGAPGAGSGSIEVVSIDDTQVHVRLLGTLAYGAQDGDYVAMRCSPISTSSTSTGIVQTPSAVVLTPEQLPADAKPCGFNPCTPPPGMLFLEWSSSGSTCQSPQGDISGNVTNWQHQIGIPVQDQAVGIYSMSDPAIFWEYGFHIVNQSTGSGTTSGGAGDGYGSLEIVSIDDTQMHVKITGITPEETGEFIAPRCAGAP